jgi:hypothetical protein
MLRINDPEKASIQFRPVWVNTMRIPLPDHHPATACSPKKMKKGFSRQGNAARYLVNLLSSAALLSGRAQGTWKGVRAIW